MTRFKAFVFDLNGTMINDMNYHIMAWHRLLNGLGADISIEETKHQCYGKNQELLERIFPGRFTDEVKKQISEEKEMEYQQGFRPHLKLLNGLDEFLRKAHSDGIKMAIGSAAIMKNIDFVLDGLNIRRYFDTLISADDVQFSKPHPETFTKCAEALRVDPSECLVFEDSPKGAEAAKRAGMQCFIISTMHKPHEFDESQVMGFAEDFTGDLFDSLIHKQRHQV